MVYYVFSESCIEYAVMRYLASKNAHSGLYAFKIHFNSEIRYALYSYHSKFKYGVQYTDFYSTEAELISNHPECTLYSWVSIYIEGRA